MLSNILKELITFFKKMLRASLLRSELYKEVGRDKGSIRGVVLVILICGICDGIGFIGIRGAEVILPAILSRYIGWFLLCAVIYLVGVKMFEHTSDMGEIMRVTGFANSPGVLAVLGIIPVAGNFIRAVSFLWMIAAYIVAVRQSLDCSTARSIFIVIQGFIIFLIVYILFVLFDILF